MLTTSYPLWPGHYRGNFIRAIAREFVRQNHKVKIVTPGCLGSPTTEQDHGIQINRYSYFPFKKYQCLTTGEGIIPNLKNKWLAWIQIPFYLFTSIHSAKAESSGSDIIHAHWSVSGIAALLCRLKHHIPVITSIRGSDYQIGRRHPINVITENITRRVDGVITENRLLKGSICTGGVDRYKVVSIHNGVDLENFRPGTNGFPLREKMGIQYKRVILFMGRLTRVKGPDLELAAFKKIAEQFSDAVLVIVGDGDMGPQLARQCDIVTIHVSGQYEKPLLDGKKLDMMKKGAWLVNVARGGAVDEKTLLNALRNGRLAGAALDVFEKEPYNGPFQELGNVILTPHIGSYAKEARVEMEMQATKNLIEGIINRSQDAEGSKAHSRVGRQD